MFLRPKVHNTHGRTIMPHSSDIKWCLSRVEMSWRVSHLWTLTTSRYGWRFSTCMISLRLQLWKADVIRHEHGWWCKFHKVKGHHTEDYYELKKEIEHLIHEGHLKKYVKGDSSQRERERDNARSSGPRKGKDLCKEDGNKTVCHTLNIIAEGFIVAKDTSSSQRRYAC